MVNAETIPKDINAMPENSGSPTTNSTQRLIVFNIWSYRGDEEKIIFCVQSLRRFWPSELIYIWDDANSPMRESFILKLKKLHCICNTTKYPRKGNLIGESCIEGMMENYIESSKCGVKYIAKIDPDCLILQEIEFLGKGCFCKGTSDPYGGFYYFDGKLVNLFKSYLYEPNFKERLLNKRYFKDKFKFAVLEDYTFYHLASYLFGDEVELKKENYWGISDENPIQNFGTRSSDKKTIIERMRKSLRRQI